MGYDSSNMPTPASTHGSPNMSGESPLRMMATYPNSRSSSQQPATPGYSRPDIEWAGHTAHQMSLPGSQRSSPMAMPASTDMMAVDAFETTSSPSHHGISTPAPEQHYWGAYGVPSSEHPNEFMPLLPSQHLYDPAANPHAVPPTLLSNHPPVSTHSMMLPSSSAQVPVLPRAPHQFGLNMGMAPRQFMGVQPTVVPKRKSLPRKTQTTRARTRRTKKTAAQNENAEVACKDEPASPEACLIALIDDADELIELQGGVDGADEQTLYVYSLWKKFYHLKGKGMWDSILDEWRTRYGPSEKPKLQMKIQRGVFNHAIWPDSEVSMTHNPSPPGIRLTRFLDPGLDACNGGV